MNMAETQHNSSSWQVNFLLSITLSVLFLTLGVSRSQAIYQENENYHEPLSSGYGYADASNQLPQPKDELPDNFFDVEVSKKDGVDGKDFFPMLMPKVHPTEEESYLCTPIEIKDKEYYITGFRPKAHQHTAHHMLIYACEEPGTQEELWNCGEMMNKGNDGLEHFHPCKRGSEIIYGWAKDAPDLELPDGVGFKVGKDSPHKYLILQVHYAHVDMIPKDGDSSGIFLHYTHHPQPKIAGVFLLGTSGYAPRHSTTYFETACEMDDDREIHPFAFRTHTHSLGKVVSGWRVQNMSHWDLIGKRSPQKPQMFYPVADESVTLKKGDVVAARCTMVNNRDRVVWIGATNNDEMCNFYIMFWVYGSRPVHPNICFSPGPPEWSWYKSAMLRNVPEKEASTLN
jgi:peptidylglycine monooxygenase